MHKQPDRHDRYQNNLRWKYLELENILREYSFDTNDKATQPIAAWVMKAFELVDSMLALSRTNSEIGMIVICRSVMEYCLWAKFISIDPENNIERWKLAEIRNEIASLKQKHNSFYEILELKKEQKTLEENGYCTPRITDIFNELNEPELNRPYDWLSKYTHGKLAIIFDEVFKKRGGDEQYTPVMFAELREADKILMWEGAALFLKFGIEAIRSREILDEFDGDSNELLDKEITVRNLARFVKWKFPGRRVEVHEGKSLQSIVTMTRIANISSLSEVNKAVESATGFLRYCDENAGTNDQITLAGSVLTARALAYRFQSVRTSGIVSDKYVSLAEKYIDHR